MSSLQQLERIRVALIMNQLDFLTVFNQISPGWPDDVKHNVRLFLFSTAPYATKREFMISMLNHALFLLRGIEHAHCAILVLVKLPRKYNDIFRTVYKEYLHPQF
jgi:hypothetical protein